MPRRRCYLQALPEIFVAWLKKAPLVLWVQDLWPESLAATGFVKNRWLLRLVESAVRYIYRHCDSILIQSEAFRVAVESRLGNRSKIRYFPNSAADLSDSEESARSCRDLTTRMQECFAVVFTGNIGRAQSCETIVAAARLLRDLPEVRFYIVGGGSMLEPLAALVEKIGCGTSS